MLHDDSLAVLLKNMLNEKIQDPLSYQDYPFDMEDWSNIPSLVPKYIIHINNHLKAIINHCRRKNEEEPSDSLRKDVFNNFHKRDDDLIKQMDDNQTEHNELQVKCQSLKSNIESIEDKILKDKQKQDQQASQLLFQLFNAKTEEFENEFDDKDKHSFICDTWATKEPRAFSIYQIRQLINFGLQKSNLKKKVESNQSQIDILRMQIADLIDWKKDLETRLSQTNQQTTKKFDETHTLIGRNFDDLNRRCFELQERHNSNQYKLERHQEYLDENFVFREVIQSRCDQLNDKIKKLRENTKLDLDLQTKNTMQKVEELVQELNNQLNYTRKEMDRIKTDITDIMDMKHEQVLSQMESDVAQIETMFNDLKAQQEKFREDLRQKNKQRIMKIKDICAKFFEKTEKLTNKNLNSVQEIEKTFENWKLNVMKPTQIAEARLFAIEAQLAEDENERVAEFQYTKDILKKLIYAIENQFGRSNQYDTIPLSQTQNPSLLINNSTIEEMDPLNNSLMNNSQQNSSRTELPNVVLQQPKFQFGTPSDPNYNNSLIQQNQIRRHSLSRKLARLKEQSQSFITERSSNVMFKNRMQFIKSALEQDTILIPQFKQKLPLKHKDQFKVSFMQDVSVNDSQFDKNLIDNTQPSIVSDPLMQDSLSNEQQESSRKPFQKSKLSTITAQNGKISPKGLKIQNLLSNNSSNKKTLNPLSKFKINNNYTNSDNYDNYTTGPIETQTPYSIQSPHQINTPVTTNQQNLEGTFSKEPNFKTVSTTNGDQGIKSKFTTTIYNHADRVEANLKEHQYRLEQELNDKRIHKRQKMKSEVREVIGSVNFDANLPSHSKRL